MFIMSSTATDAGQVIGGIFGVIVTLGISGLIIYFVYRAGTGIGGYFGNWLDYLSPAPAVNPSSDPDKSEHNGDTKK